MQGNLCALSTYHNLWCAHNFLEANIVINSASAYFAEGPKSLASSCDIVLVLDNGVRLPAHSHVLARLSPVFSDMLDEGSLSRASRDSPVEVPLSECSTDEAIHFFPCSTLSMAARSREQYAFQQPDWLTSMVCRYISITRGYLYHSLSEHWQCLWE